MTALTPSHATPKVEERGNVVTLTFTGGGLRGEANVVGRELASLSDILGRSHVVLDCRNVRSVNSAELGTLFHLHERMKTSGGRLTLINLIPEFYEAIEAAKLDTLLEISRLEPLGSAAVGKDTRKSAAPLFEEMTP